MESKLELFNGTIETLLENIPDDYHLTFGKPNVQGSYNIRKDLFIAALTSVLPAKGTIVNAQLDGNYKYSLNHGRGTEDLVVELYDGSGNVQSGPNLWSVIDSNNITFNLGSSITGTWKFIIQFF